MFNLFKSKGNNGEKAEKPIGVVTHFYGGIEVAIVKFNIPVAVGTKLHFKGATTDFTDTARSIQYNHQAIEEAKKGQEVGIKVKDKVREGDEVYLVA
jgi:translation initiation factor IF-2